MATTKEYKYDFAKIAADNRIETVAGRLNLPLKRSLGGGALRTTCPKCGGDEHKLSISPEHNNFMCWGCMERGKPGDCIDLVALVLGKKRVDAAAWIVGDTYQPEKSAAAEKPGVGFTLPDYLDFEHPAVEELGFSAEIARRLGVAFWPKGYHKGMVGVPLRFPICPHCNSEVPVSGVIGIEDAKLPPKFRF